MMHKPPQKRIYFVGATYFITCVTHSRIEYFKEPIFCELFVEILKMAKRMHKFNLYSLVVLVDHFHVMFCPHNAEDLSKIMQFIKRNLSRNINFVLGYEPEEAIYKSLLRVSGKFEIYKDLIREHNEILFKFRKQFLAKYGANQNQFYKFRWLKSYRDHYIRNSQDFQEHLDYIYKNPCKHKITDPEKYQYIYTQYPKLIDEL